MKKLFIGKDVAVDKSTDKHLQPETWTCKLIVIDPQFQ